MTTAIDRVANSIQHAIDTFGTYPIPPQFLAERAILALRCPPDDMMQAFNALPQYHNRLDMWCAMIDVALGRLVLSEEENNEGHS